MRRVFCLISAIVILGLCALPAFALGEDYGGARYNGIPFDSLVISGYGGPIEYFGAESRVGTELDGSIFGFPEDRLILYGTACTAQYLTTTYECDFVPASGATSTTQVSFVMNQKYAKINEGGLRFKFDARDDTSFTVTSIEVTGSYYTVYSSSGKPHTGYVNFGKTFTTNLTNTSATYDFAPYILDAIDFKPIGNGVYFKNLTVNFRVRRDSGDGDLQILTIGTPYGTYTEPVSFSNWLNPALSSFDYSNASNNDFNLGLFLKESVDAFMGLEILPNFTIGSLFIASISFGVLLWFIRTVH